MIFRLAGADDLPQIKAVYDEIIGNMNDNQIEIWDDVYPCGFFEEDIKQRGLYLTLDNDVIVSAFSLCKANNGADSVNWESGTAKALYLDRFGVNVNYLRKGIGSLTLEKAKETAKKSGAEYLRLFVVDINYPAVRLYEKNGFKKARGIFHEIIDDELVLHEYGYEIKLI